MTDETTDESHVSQQLHGGTNWKQCILCQKDGENVVSNPRIDSYKCLINAVQERASLHDGEFVKVNQRLKDCTGDILQKQKAVWHRACYSSATNKAHIQRAKDRHQLSLSSGSHTPREPGRRSLKRKSSDAGDPSPCASSIPFTRSSTRPLDKDLCFFCQEDDMQKLFNVRTENAGNALKEAVEISNNPVLKTRYSTTISPGDAHAIDVKYHKACWTEHVFHVLRHESVKKSMENDHTMQNACFIELINLIDLHTKNKEYLSMEDIDITYINLLGGRKALENHYPVFTRQWLKERILTELPNVKSVLQRNRRCPSLLYCPQACEADMVESAITAVDGMDNMRIIYKAAQLIRKQIEDFPVTEGDMRVSSSVDDVPVELYTIIRWIMFGPVDEFETEERTNSVDRTSLTISQNIMFGFKSKRQTAYKPRNECATFRTQQTRENPQVLGLALSVHHDTRNRLLVDILHAHNYCVSYKRTLKLETALANAVVENTKKFQGLFVPAFLRKGAFVFFAADNTDFAEDTADGKGTTHGTIIAVYQKADVPGDPIAPPLQITETDNMSVTPHHTVMLPCVKPKLNLQANQMTRNFNINKTGVEESYQLTHMGWVVASIISRMNKSGESQVPGWAGYNSLLSTNKAVTKVGALPLLPEVAHEWSTLLTVLMQACKLKELAVGETHPAVITFDMALYEKVVQLVDSRPDLKGRVLPRLGELHVVMAALRGLGASIENSGIDDAWMEADVYGSATTRQILKCTHYKRSFRAHIYSYMALYEMAFEEFFRENPDLKDVGLAKTTEVEELCAKRSPHESMKCASAQLLQTVDDLLKRFKDWEIRKSENAMFKALMNYLHRVETIMFFVAASRNADLKLHLESGEALSRIFFAMDRIKYKRLWPRYIADMYALKTEHKETWTELELGNISVTKSAIPFVSIGADHACEHLNKLMKVHAGLIGISSNANARQRFFMATHELSCMSKEFKDQFSVKETETAEHHDLSPSVIKREHSTVSKIKAAIMRHGNPFAIEGHTLYNLITHAYIPEQYVPQILNIDDSGQKLYEEYVAERINGKVSLWAPVKKEQNKMYISGSRSRAVKVRDKTIDLKETKELYGRLMVLARSSRDINQKYAIGNYEFTLTPRALFAPSGSILPCNDKSKLIHVLEKLSRTDAPAVEYPQPDEDAQMAAGDVSNEDPRADVLDVHDEDPQANIGELRTDDRLSDTDDAPNPCRKIAVVDGMVLVQKMTKKPATVVTVKDLSECFNERLTNLTRDYDEVILVFDTYKEDSLKQMTREKRQGGKDPIQYQVRDETSIKHISLSRFLSHSQTKADLTVYLAAKTLEYNMDSTKVFITSAAGYTRSNTDLRFDDNNHEEADTLLIHQAVLAAQRGTGNDQLTFFSPDTDVLTLIIANYDQLPKDTSISMVSGVLQIEPIWTTLGRDKAKALPALHAFSGADNIGRFARVGKTTWFKLFLEADEHVVQALTMLASNSEVSEDQLSTLASFVCTAYCPKGIQIRSVPELRWHLFCKQMAESDRLPPTYGALKQHILRVHVQARVWGQASIAHQVFVDPLKNGYHLDIRNQLKPTTTDVPPAPVAIIEMVRCMCKGDCTSQRCSCKSKDLQCTDLCQCSSECDNDEDSYFDNRVSVEESDD